MVLVNGQEINGSFDFTALKDKQINSLIAYLPYLNLNGLYIVEDIVHRDYYKIFLRVKDILTQKNFEVSYHKFHVPGKAGISDLLGYMTIKRK